MSKSSARPKVFFNASVILAGINSSKGASAALLEFVKLGKVKGAISILIFHEVVRNAYKIGKEKVRIEKFVNNYFSFIHPPPKLATVRKYHSVVLDPGDAHVLASAEETKSDILVSLDKKHILMLRNKIKLYKILSPGELLILLTSLG